MTAVSSTSSTTPVWTIQPNGIVTDPALSKSFTDALNARRAKFGKKPLGYHPIIQGIADYKAWDMASYLYMAHDDAGQVTRRVVDRFADWGVTQWAWGENIGYGFLTAESLLDAFEGEGPNGGHYQNMLNDSWNVVGSGVARSTNGLLFWCQDYGAFPNSQPVPPDPTPVPPPQPVPHVKPAKGQIWANKTTGVLVRVVSVIAGVVAYQNMRTGMVGSWTTQKFKNKYRYVRPS